jgi:hypothetical protein
MMMMMTVELVVVVVVRDIILLSKGKCVFGNKCVKQGVFLCSVGKMTRARKRYSSLASKQETRVCQL